MLKRLKISVGTLFVLAVMIILMKPSNVQAAGLMTLSPDVQYSSYDFTGDKKADTFQIVQKGFNDFEYSGLEIFVNGKSAYSFSDVYFMTQASLITLKNNKPFLYLYCSYNNGDGPVMGVLQYKNGKFKKVIDFAKPFYKYGNHVNGKVLSVKGNKITTEVYTMSNTIGGAYFKFQYKYSGGTLKRAGKTGKLSKMYTRQGETNRLTVNRSIKAYSKAGGSRVKFTLKKGQVLKITKCKITKKGLYYGIKCKGKTGWIKALKKFPGYPESKYLFSDVAYAG